jgi:hypothetical protein
LHRFPNRELVNFPLESSANEIAAMLVETIKEALDVSAIELPHWHLGTNNAPCPECRPRRPDGRAIKCVTVLINPIEGITFSCKRCSWFGRAGLKKQLASKVS